MSYEDLSDEKRDSFLSKIVFRYLPYWPLYLILLLSSVASAWTYLRYSIPIFRSNANILIKDEAKGIYESQLSEALNPFGSSKIIENETVILESRSLMKEVVKNLNLYAPIYHKGRIKSGSAYVSSPVRIEVLKPDSIHEGSNLYFSYNDTTEMISFNGYKYKIFEWIRFNGDSIRFIPNNKRSDEFDNNSVLYFSLGNVNDVAESFSVSASPSDKYSTVINLEIEDDVPEKAADILNDLISEYNKASIADKNRLAANTVTFVEERLKYVVSELDSVEGALQQYKTGENIVDISTQGQLFLQNVGELDKQLSQINIQLSVLDQIEAYVKNGKSKNTNTLLPSTFGINDPMLTGLLEKFYDLDIQLERLRNTTAENNFVVVSIKDQILNIKPAILGNITSLRSNLEATKRNLSRANSGYAAQIKNIPQKEKGLLNISRQQSIKNNIYTFLLEKREEAALSFGSTVADLRIIDPAIPPKYPIKPNKLWTYLIGVFLGTFLFIIIIQIKDFVNTKIVFRKDIEEFLDWPVIGEISENKGKESVVINNTHRNAISEQFRSVRNSLLFLGNLSQCKKVLITSSISGEGKSFASLNLALSLALADKRVLLLEFDLRKPKISQTLEIDKGTPGLSNYLIDRASLDEILMQVNGYENFYFIPSGVLPPNPSELILNGRVELLLDEIKPQFDFVIIDSAPVIPVSDSIVLSKYADVTLFIIRHNRTPKMHLKKLRENMRNFDLKNPYIIFNGIKTRGVDKYGYGYTYGSSNYTYDQKVNG